MGLENRDYVRDAPPPGGYGYGGYGGGSGMWAVKALLIANIVVFILQITTGAVNNNRVGGGVTEWLDLRMASKIGSEPVQFYETEFDGGSPPRRIRGPVDFDAPGDATLDPGTSIEPIGRYEGNVSLVHWNGRYGIVRSDGVAVAPFQSWQLLWRLITYGFLHGGLMHIAFNMFVLFVFGRIVEPIYGSKEFFLFFLGGIIAAGLAHVVFQTVAGENVPAVGASGGVMAVVFLTAMHFPRVKVLLMFVIPIELRWLAIGYAIIDVVGAFNPHGSTIAHAAHLGGAAFGVAYKYYGWRLSGLLSGFSGWGRSLKKLKSKPKLRVHRPKPEPTRGEDIDARVDKLLAKITEQGESSLTDEEREFLADASRRYRGR